MRSSSCGLRLGFCVFWISTVVGVDLADLRAQLTHDLHLQRYINDLGHVFKTNRPSASRAAGTIATAAFFAPEMVTSPFSVLPPLITYFVNLPTPH